MRLGFYLLYYGVGKSLFTIIFRVIFRTRVVGRERIPCEDGLLVVCNHISFADPPLLGAIMPRPVEFMTMAEMFRKPWMARLLRTAGCFPLDRSRVDHRGAREAIRRLRAGRCVVIFPEGGIRLTEQSVLGGDPVFKPGAGSIALLGEAAILPVIVRGTRKPYTARHWLPFHRGRLQRETMSVTFGSPFCLWNPAGLATDERRRRADEMLREQLLKTVELD
ncbi:MAG TPA: lysophospholipid acyltransferase family protein [Verrucomicrobiae bacterium]|nr:lysophospholipid acyltransferase family protein [Verrucomicrobiae bacterium]